MQIANNQLVEIFIGEVQSTDGQKLIGVGSSFVTKLTPMYSTPLKIREIAGSYITEITDDILNQLILKYSLEADVLAVCDITTWEKWAFYASKWVTLKVAIDSVFNSDMYITTHNRGKSYKKLGDFSISTDLKSNDPVSHVKKFLEKLECDIFKLNVSVKLCKEPLIECDSDLLESIASSYTSPAKTVVKGGARGDSPIFGRTFAKNGNHPQWTGWLKKANRQFLSNYVDYDSIGYKTSDRSEAK